MKTKFKCRFLLGFLLSGAVFSACEETGTDGPGLPVGALIDVLRPDDGFKVARCRVLNVRTTLTDTTGWKLRWTLGDSLLSMADTLRFISLTSGEKTLSLHAVAPDSRSITINFTVDVLSEPTPYTPYVTAVHDFRPAPGQFVNEMPRYTDGDTQQTMNEKVLASIGADRGGVVSLGAWGGYVVVGFDHTIVNLPGAPDFRVLGNTFLSSASGSSTASDADMVGGNCEPGIIYVALDENGNGLPDDPWYEIAGSAYTAPDFTPHYAISYERPAADHTATAPEEAENAWETDTRYIRWTDNAGETGWLSKLTFHKQDYFPRWIDEDRLSFTGSRLPDNGTDLSTTGTNWFLRAFSWGYADNMPNNHDASAIDISWAVDSAGRKVNLPGIDFVKIQTGVRQTCGWLGETSTEVAGVTDLHLVSE